MQTVSIYPNELSAYEAMAARGEIQIHLIETQRSKGTIRILFTPIPLKETPKPEPPTCNS